MADAVAQAERLETFPFGVDQLVLITPARHPLAGRRQIAFEEVLDCDFVGLAPDSALQAHINDHAVCAGRPLRLRVSLPSFDAICRIVESGIGVAIVPQLAAQRCRRSMAIRAVRLIDAWAFRHLRLCVRNFRSLPAHAQWLVQHLNPPADISPSLVSA